MTRIVTIRNRNGHALHCMLDEPDAMRRDVVCVLLSPGVKMRVAPHRLYRKLASEFLARGIAVLRMDFHGLGDSEGDLPEEQLDQVYRQVGLGRHVVDVQAGLDYLQGELGADRFIVGGLCGGALTALLTGERDRRVAAVYAIGMPVALDGSGAHEAVNMTRAQLTSMRTRYFRKMLRPAAWLKFLSFRSDYRLLWRSLSPAARRQRRVERLQSVQVAEVPLPSLPTAENLNPRFAPAFFSLLARHAPLLLLYSGADRLHWEYQEKFAAPWVGPLAQRGASITLEVIDKANHILSDPAWIARSKQLTGAWLDRHFAR